MAFEEYLAEDRRLCILKLLTECGGEANESVLHMGLEALGHTRQPRHKIREDLRFLVDLGLCTENWYKDVLVCSITKRGVETAEGRITIPGVKSPSIGS